MLQMPFSNIDEKENGETQNTYSIRKPYGYLIPLGLDNCKTHRNDVFYDKHRQTIDKNITNTPHPYNITMLHGTVWYGTVHCSQPKPLSQLYIVCLNV